MMKDVRRLHALGFSVHLLKEKSKAPIEKGWSKGPRKTIMQLKHDYRPGANIGVRLGQASKVGDFYLAVIDCDVKSKDPKHLGEMQDKLTDLFGAQIVNAPQVLSGRGNGSRHYYIVTKEPASPARLAQSSIKVKVHMPSIKASRADAERLNGLEIGEGMRMRAAWEISLMGEGQQVVLPPSIHPDSGKAYLWATPLKEAADLPLIEPPAPKAQNSDYSVNEHSGESFEPESVMWDLERVSDRIVGMIRTGEGVEDRSAALFSAALAMCGAGMSDNAILSVLTDRKNFLGEVAYGHTQSGSRKRAAEWVRKYTLKRARFETDAARDFDTTVEIAPLGAVEAEAQRKEIVAEIASSETWRAHIERSGQKGDGPPKPTLKNLILILEFGVSREVFRRDEFAAAEIHGAPNPWRGSVSEEVRDIDLMNIKKWCADEFRFEPNVQLVNEAVQVIAHKNRFHPVREYLATLPAWDGKPRLSTWLEDYMSASSESVKYLRAVSMRSVLSMIARVMRPGVKCDTVMVFHGEQGVLKSTMIAELARPWGSDAKLDINDKDGVLAMRGAWVVELGELSSLGRTEVDQVKEFVARATDRIRLPYGKRTEAFPRQCIFMGTTNNFEFLRDETGNRRFWPVTVGVCRPKEFAKVRDQIFAEALVLYGIEPHWLSEEEEKLAKREQERHSISDTWDEKLRDFLAQKREHFDAKKFTLNELFFVAGDVLGWRDDRATHLRIGRSLRVIGYRKTVLIDKHGVQRKTWMKPETELSCVRWGRRGGLG